MAAARARPRMAEAGAPRRPPSRGHLGESRRATASSALRTASAACQAAVGAGRAPWRGAPWCLRGARAARRSGRRRSAARDGGTPRGRPRCARAPRTRPARAPSRAGRWPRTPPRSRPARRARRRRRPAGPGGSARGAPSSWRRNARSTVAPDGSGSGVGVRPASWSAVSSDGSSASASGLPCAVSSSLRATEGAMPVGVALVQELLGLGGRQRPDGQRLEARRRGVEAHAVAAGQEQHDVLGLQAAGGEQQGVARRVVEPLDVVHQHQHRARVGSGVEQAEHGGGDGEAVRRLAALQRQRARQRVLLHGRQRVAVREDGREQLRQAGVGQARLALQAARPQEAEAALLRVRRRVVEQRRLADAGLPVQEQGPAPAVPGRLEQAIHARPLRCPSRPASAPGQSRLPSRRPETSPSGRRSGAARPRGQGREDLGGGRGLRACPSVAAIQRSARARRRGRRA